MNTARRVVVAVALAAGLAVIARTLTALVLDQETGGWFMYDASGAGVPFSSDGGDADALWTAMIWLAAIGAWAAVAWRLFGARSDRVD